MSAQRKRTDTESTSHVLEELQGRSDKVAQWITDNPLVILASMGAILVIAAVWGLVGWSQQGAISESSNALAAVDRDYRRAMGAQIGQIEIPEPANPDAALGARTQAVAGYAAVTQEHAGTPASAVAAIQKGHLERLLGEEATALESWQAGVDQAEGPMRGMVLVRIASLHEDAGRMAEAAASYEEAAGIADYPLRHQALADAARCRAETGDAEAAIALLQRIEGEAPELRLAPHVQSRLNELRALRSQ